MRALYCALFTDTHKSKHLCQQQLLSSQVKSTYVLFKTKGNVNNSTVIMHYTHSKMTEGCKLVVNNIK